MTALASDSRKILLNLLMERIAETTPVDMKQAFDAASLKEFTYLNELKQKLIKVSNDSKNQLTQQKVVSVRELMEEFIRYIETVPSRVKLRSDYILLKRNLKEQGE